MLLTRSPLSGDPKVPFALDLHVLGTPPAFVLSQDQTLREVLRSSLRSDLTLGRAELALKSVSRNR